MPGLPIPLVIAKTVELGYHRAFFGPLAQSVEHLTFNQVVVRSSRTRPTIHEKARLHGGLFRLRLFILLLVLFLGFQLTEPRSDT